MMRFLNKIINYHCWFGRFGQIIARIARLQHLGFTAIDNNLHQVDFVRRYGGKLYYGDVTQPDLLRSAGIEKRKYLF